MPNEGTRPAIVTVVAWLFIVGGVLGLLGTLMVLVLRAATGAPFGIPFSTAVGMLLLILLTIVPGSGMLYARPWSWFLTSLVAFAGVFSLPLAAYFAFGSFADSELSVMPWFLVAVTGLSLPICLLLYIFLLSGKVRDYFKIPAPMRTRAVLGHLAIFLVVAVPAVYFLDGFRKDHAKLARLITLQNMATGGTTDPSALRYARERLALGGAEERIQAIWALKADSSPETIKILEQAAREDDDLAVRVNAVTILAKIEDDTVIDTLVACLGDESQAVRGAALGGLTADRLAGNLDLVLQLLTDDDASVRTLAVETLARPGNVSVLPRLQKLSDDEDSNVRSSVAFALGKIGAPDAIPTLTQMASDDAWDVRANAAVALGKIGDRAARPVLAALLDDPNGQVRTVAEDALTRLP